jgi:hypothetical protein
MAALLTLPLGVIGDELGLRWGIAGLGVLMFVAAAAIGASGMLKLQLIPAEDDMAFEAAAARPDLRPA